MIFQTSLLNLNILLLSMSTLYECKKIHANYSEEFINLAVISDYVYIGGKHSLAQLNSSLDIVNIKHMKGSNWLLTPYKAKNEITILIACDYKGEYETECIGYRSNLSIVEYTKTDILIREPQARYTTTTLGADNILTIASSDCLKHATVSTECFAISNYKKEIQYVIDKGTNVKYLDAKKNNRFIFDFRTVVGHDKYTYFLFVFNNTVSKLGKICKDANTFKRGHNAYEDVPIFCSHNGVNFTTAQDLMFWNDDLLVVFTDSSASVICKFTKLFDNFATSRITRLRCPLNQPDNTYFISEYIVCYNETMKKCQSRTDATVVSII